MNFVCHIIYRHFGNLYHCLINNKTSQRADLRGAHKHNHVSQFRTKQARQQTICLAKSKDMNRFLGYVFSEPQASLMLFFLLIFGHNEKKIYQV